MPEKIIVSLLVGDTDIDVELPSMVPVGSIIEPLKKTLCLSPEFIRKSSGRAALFHEKNILPEDLSLFQLGIFDGAILELHYV